MSAKSDKSKVESVTLMKTQDHLVVMIYRNKKYRRGKYTHRTYYVDGKEEAERIQNLLYQAAPQGTNFCWREPLGNLISHVWLEVPRV
jgi:hypothetical protein